MSESGRSVPLANAKHERFAQELAKGLSATDAYVAAGYAESRSAASRLSTNVNIQDRVAALQDKGAERAVVTLESLLHEAEEARLMAMKIMQPGAAIAAIKEKGVLTGLRVEKRENTNKASVNEMTDEELAAIASGSRDGDPETSRGSSLPH